MATRLVPTEQGLGLVDDDAPDLSPLVMSFEAPRKLTKADDLIKAVGWEKGLRHVVDATGGLGRDALALATFGFHVVACEENPLLQSLWEDALARHTPPRLRFEAQDAVGYLTKLVADDARPEVIYLDPMYPHGPRKALQQRELRLIKAAVASTGKMDANVVDAANEVLFDTAMATATRRVVVKRPSWAPPLVTAGITHRYQGRSTRYDLYVVPPKS